MRNKNKWRCGIIATALVLLALSVSPAAYGQKDGFFSNADGGLLVLTAAGLCYAGAKKVKRVKSKE